jgi:large subunit ribosomal protein L18
MADKVTYKTLFRRRREGKTDYTKRLALVRSKTPRLVVRKSNKRIVAQVINFDLKGDTTIASVDSNELKNYKWYGTNNTPSAYLVGYLIGKKLAGQKCVLDIGRRHPSHGSVVFATLKGAVDGGIIIPFNKSVLPAEERMNGKTLDEYANKLGDKAKNVFSKYIKEGIMPGEFNKAFEKAKAEIEKVKA